MIMKDLTHYFHSPDKAVVTPLSEDVIVTDETPIQLDTTPNESHTDNVPKAEESECTGEFLKIEPTVRLNLSVACEEELNVTGERSVTIEKNASVDGIGKIQKVEKHFKQYSEDKIKNEDILKSWDRNKLDNGVELPPIISSSPNAFLILMSTQQIFSSTNCGKKEITPEIVENVSVNNENKKKIKANLEQMSKRKLALEAAVLNNENSVQKSSKKRRQRIIVESESDNESSPLKDQLFDDLNKKNPRKRKKETLNVNTETKIKKIRSDFPENVAVVEEINCDIEGKLDDNKEDTLSTEVKHQLDESVQSLVIEDSYQTKLEKENTNLDESSPVFLNEKYDNSLQNESTNEFSDAKRKRNILNYFNKVSNDEKRRHSDKIKVIVDVHFPVVSTDRKSKPVVSKKKFKSKRKSFSGMEDDIQIIESVTIEDSDVSLTTGNTECTDITRIKRPGVICDKNEEKATKKTLSSPVVSSVQKGWKLKIRMAENADNLNQSPRKSISKKKSPLKRKKIIVNSGQKRNTVSNTSKMPRNKVNPHGEVSIVEEVLMKNKPKAKKMLLSDSSSKSKKMTSVRSTLREKGETIDEIKVAPSKKTNSLKKSVKISGNSSEFKIFHNENVPLKKMNTKSENRSDARNTAQNNKTILMNPGLEDENLVTLKSSPTSANGKLTVLDNKSTISKKPEVKRLKSKNLYQNELLLSTTKKNKFRNTNKTVKNAKSSEEKNISLCKSKGIFQEMEETILFVNSKKNKNVKEIDEIQSNNSRKNYKKQMSINSNTLSKKVSYLSDIESSEEGSVTFIKGSDSMPEKSENTTSQLRRSSRKRIAIHVPDVGISDYESDPFDCDSEDDFLGDSDGLFDEDGEWIGPDDGDETIFVFKKKKPVTVRNKINLDQKLVLQFLKNAKGTLSKKMALNDSTICLDKQPNTILENSAPVKLAPLFLSRKPKKLDEATMQARKAFLESGMPDTIKKIMDIQKAAEEKEHAVFPSVSHVQQKEEGSFVWCMSDALQKFSPVAVENWIDSHFKISIESFINCSSENINNYKYSASCPQKINVFREFLRTIKAESPDFPVYRTFRHLCELRQSFQKDSSKQGFLRKGRRRKSPTNKMDSIIDSQSSENSCALWTAKYRPLASSYILGNAHNVTRLKKWLELWVQVNNNTFQKRGIDDDSADEFLTDANDDDDDVKKPVFPKTTAILVGPEGSGKTMAVYTLAHELGYKVLEVNASTKRTGRQILVQLQETTQCHLVNGKGDENGNRGIKGLFAANEKAKRGRKSGKKGCDAQKSKLSLILIEDVDIVFEEDEGFVSALSTLVNGSKIPFILITSDPKGFHLSRFLEKSLVLNFEHASCKRIGVWLQLIALIEGIRVRRSSVEELLKFNKGDTRKTLLQLQFWVLTGGDNNEQHTDVIGQSRENLDIADDISNSSWVSIDDKKAENVTQHPIHAKCVNSFLMSDLQTLLIDSGKIWWNIPKLIGLNSLSHMKRERKEESEILVEKETFVDNVNKVTTSEKNESSSETNLEVSRKKLKSMCSREDVSGLANLSDTLSLIENFSFVTGCRVNEPDQCPWEMDPNDSLSLVQNMQSCDHGLKDTALSIRNWLLCTGVSLCSAQLCPKNYLSLTEVLQQPPPKEEIDWRIKQHYASSQLENGVAMLNWSQRKAVAMDYLSSLRNISRLERERGCLNDKRNNRFYHYLRGLGVHLSPDVLDTACNVFSQA